MPFTSKKQQRKCYALKARGQAGSWNCEEFAAHTDFSKLPEKVKDAVKVAMIAGKSPHAAPIKPLQQLPALFQPRPLGAPSTPGTRPDGQPIVQSTAQRLAAPALGSLGNGPLNSGHYGAYGMRQPLIPGMPAPPTVAKTANLANIASMPLSDAELERMVRSGIVGAGVGTLHPMLVGRSGTPDLSAGAAARGLVTGPMAGAGAAGGSLLGSRLGALAGGIGEPIGALAGGALGGMAGSAGANALLGPDEEKTAECKKLHRFVKDKTGRFVYRGRQAAQLKDDPEYNKHMRVKTAGGLGGLLGKITGSASRATKTVGTGMSTTKILPTPGGASTLPKAPMGPKAPAPQYGPGSYISPDLRAPPPPMSKNLSAGEWGLIGAGAASIPLVDGAARMMVKQRQRPTPMPVPGSPVPPQMASTPPGAGAL